MNSTLTTCTCDQDGYTPDCPYSFVQGGRVLHEVVSNERLKPKASQIIAPIERELKMEPRLFADQFEMPPLRKGSGSSEEAFVDIEQYLEGKRNSGTMQEEVNHQANLVNADHMLAKNRTIMKKYEPLKIGENTLTDLSIGGYKVDLARTAQKASEVIPLPPARLPRIYIDPEMNFNHHFFQGLERMLGREQVLDIVSKVRHYSTDELILLPFIENVISIGYEPKDTGLTVFTKSVLSSTFNTDKTTGSRPEDKRLLVAANLWGFQYIEDGMECREADLRMWLSICYDKFRTVFFNTFKDSGMPAFAMEGVQGRYEAIKKMPDIGEELASGFNNQLVLARSRSPESYEPTDSGRSRRSHRSRKQKTVEPTIGGLLFRSKH